MSGVDTIRGIAYQQAHTVLTALDLLDSDAPAASMRVEGANDIIDVEVLDGLGQLLHAKQIKSRRDPYTWAKTELLRILQEWAQHSTEGTSFEFVTDGTLGPGGEKVAAALNEAARGNLTLLAEVFAVPVTSPLCSALSSARITVDPASTGILLARAERQVMAMLASAPTAVVAAEEARQAVDRLFRLLFVRGGDQNAEIRLFTRTELANAVGASIEQSTRQRWPGSLRPRYVDVVSRMKLEGMVPALVRAHDSKFSLFENRSPNKPLKLNVLLECQTPVILVGRTGAGKSTACHMLRQSGALKDRIVILTHAEMYLPGRLAALVADSLAVALNEDFPSATGRQVLADRDVTLVIDGASEVPSPVRAGLASDLSTMIASRRGPQVIVVGRDVAALREIMPLSVVPETFVMADLDEPRRRRLLASSLRNKTGSKADDQTILAADTKIARALGDASRNPLLYRMAADLTDDSFENRPSLYHAFIDLMASRTGTTNTPYLIAVLGSVFAKLLDKGRRYSDSYEWADLLRGAVDTLPLPIPSISVEQVDALARRAGLVVPVGYTQTVSAMHDSFADYFAANAHARGHVALPERLEAHDESRLQFLAEIVGVDDVLGPKLVRDQPFLAARLIDYDRSVARDELPSQAAALLTHLLGKEVSLTCCRLADGRIAAVRGEATRWCDYQSLISLLRLHKGVIVPPRGVMSLVVRIWREEIVDILADRPTLPPATPRTQDDARRLIERHLADVAAAIDDLIRRIAPGDHAKSLRAQVGSTGFDATIFEASNADNECTWPVIYQQSDTISVKIASSEPPSTVDKQEWGRGSTHGFLQETAHRAAGDTVRKALNQLTKATWL